MQQYTTVAEDMDTVDGMQIASGLESFQSEGLETLAAAALPPSPTPGVRQSQEAPERTHLLKMDLLKIICARQVGYFDHSKYDPINGRGGGECCKITPHGATAPQWMTLTEFVQRASGNTLTDWKESIMVPRGSGSAMPAVRLLSLLGPLAEGTIDSQLRRVSGGIIPGEGAKLFESYETLDHKSQDVAIGSRVCARWAMVDGSYEWFPGTVVDMRRRGSAGQLQHQIEYDDDGQRQW